jgi:hypothetical protein
MTGMNNLNDLTLNLDAEDTDRRRPGDPATAEQLVTELGVPVNVGLGPGVTVAQMATAGAEWGDRWAASQGQPIIYEHEGCGGRIHQRLSCEDCDAAPVPAQVRARPGPGAPTV